MKKIIAITTIRSDYDLMSGLYKLLNSDENIELKMIVAGAHMADSYGKSVTFIEKDKLEILLKLETLIESNTKQSRLKSASLLLQNSIDTIVQYNPDLIIYAGDREDTLVGAMLGGYLQIPTIHFFGGDHVPDGHIDNPVRHAVSKLSTIHMVAIDKHKERLLKLGENEERIFVIGSIALDRFFNFKPYSIQQIKEEFNIKKGFDKFAIVIFHPHDIEMAQSHIYFDNILKSLKELKIYAFVSYPNTDPGNKNIFNVISKYSDDSNFIFYKNLNREMFISIYKNSILQVGNSSAGIIESASIPIPVVNVGLRQVGRLFNDNIVFCDTEIVNIKKAIEKALDMGLLKNIKNIYGDGKSSKRAYEIMKSKNFNHLLYKTEDPLGE